MQDILGPDKTKRIPQPLEIYLDHTELIKEYTTGQYRTIGNHTGVLQHNYEEHFKTTLDPFETIWHHTEANRSNQ